MLVLTRKAGERVLIGDDIVITILDTRGDGIRIGIDAPRGVNIQRDEIVRAVTEANVEATHVANDAEARLKAALGLGPDVAPPASAAAAQKAAVAKPSDAKPAPRAVPRPPAQP
ncbi:MAG TPA: carbon storage regulator [Lacisediminihabitans sp.]|uniref:carbon storage regulator n=1 Tax=Parafrigoribacterium soli TaxID=3144663 RepID=UPI002C29285D|nr:carbon storage regulator [Lacisediminihabitans sp.]HXD62188.1 carbon storage regulator [Lacisediminihabitans sp.]